MSGSLTGRKQWKGQQLEYDAFIINSSKHLCCYCLSDTQAQALNSLIEIYQYKTRWISLSGLPIDQDLTTDWYEQLSGVLMSGCCGDENVPVQLRFEGLTLMRSTDGGITFNPAPEFDYRHTSIVWSKPSEVGITPVKCQAADSVISKIKTNVMEDITESMGAAAILAAIAAMLLVFLSAGSTAFFVAGIQGMVAAILTAGVAAWQAAFTEGVWDDFRCLIYCNMTSDETIDQAGLDAIYSGIDTTFTGIVVPSLKGYIAAAGLVGVQNMMSGMSGDPDANCDACCPDCQAAWAIWGGSHGTILDVTDEYVEVEASDGGNGDWYIIMKTNDINVCCAVDHIEAVSGTMTFNGWTDCGQTRTEGVPQHTGIGWGTCINYFQGQSADPFTIRVYFVECP